jgi:hypothetical protein
MADILSDVSISGQRRWFGIPAWMVAVVGLLVLLLAVTTASHHLFVPLCFVLLPVFLFGRVENSEQRLSIAFGCDARHSSDPDRSALFQRPPPFLA